MVLVHCTSPNVTYLCIKFEVISFNTFEVMPRTRFCDRWTCGRTDGRTDRVTPVQNTKEKEKVLVTSSFLVFSLQLFKKPFMSGVKSQDCVVKD